MHELLLAGRAIRRVALPEGDPYLSNVTMLMHMDGSPGTATFPDTARKVTFGRAGNPVISADQSRYGNGSAYFDGSGGYIGGGYYDGYSFGTGDFTIEAYVYFLSLVGTYGYNTIVTCVGTNSDGGGANRWALIVSSTGELMFDNAPENGTNRWGVITAPGTIKINRWHHVAVSKIGNSAYLHIDGIQMPLATNSFVPGKAVNGSGAIRIGRLFSNSAWSYITKGYIDEVRITKGVGRYLDSFVVPTTPFIDPA